MELDKQTSERFRALASFSQLELKPAREIKSHRKIIGPIIVALKRMSWPLIKIHLKDSFESLEQFSAWSLDTIAKQQVELENLKRREKSN